VSEEGRIQLILDRLHLKLKIYMKTRVFSNVADVCRYAQEIQHDLARSRDYRPPPEARSCAEHLLAHKGRHRNQRPLYNSDSDYSEHRVSRHGHRNHRDNSSSDSADPDWVDRHPRRRLDRTASPKRVSFEKNRRSVHESQQTTPTKTMTQPHSDRRNRSEQRPSGYKDSGARPRDTSRGSFHERAPSRERSNSRDRTTIAPQDK
jgi:hypothetical protein